MSYFLKLILSLSLSGTLLVLILLLSRPVYRNRLSKHWQYYIWLVVIVRLLLPITPETSLVGSLIQRVGQIHLSDMTVIQPNEHNSSNSDTIADFSADSAEEKIDSGDIGSTAEPNTPTDNSLYKSTDNSHNVAAALFLIAWLIVGMLLFMRKVTVYQSFVKYLNAGSKPIDDISLLENFGQIIAQNRIRGSIDLYTNSLISSPLLIGFIHPRIILPDADLSGSDFYYTMLHELVHYKRRDMFYKWLVQLTICLHWFNPTVYLMGREINRLCELSCDERVIKTLSEEDRKAYGDTLLNAADTGGSYRDALASVTLNENKELLKGRLEAIMSYRKMTKSIRTAAILFTGILIGAATVLGAYASPAGRTASDAGIYKNVSDSDGNQALDYSIQHENGIYYVLAHGATEADKPISGVTSLYNMLILVRKDSYATFGAWDDYDMQSLVRHISEQCRTRLANGQLTQEDMDIVIAAATEIQQTYLSGSGNVPDRRTYAYRQTASYQSPYIILYGYNLPSSARGSYKNMTVALADGLNIQIYFSEETEKFMSDDKAMSAITSMIRHRLLPKSSSSRPLEALFIVSMEDVGDTDLSSLAEKYYKEERLNYFCAVFVELDSAAQQKYLALAYDDQNISFFASCIDDSSTDTVDHYILKAYEDDRVDFFAVLSGVLDEESRQQWLERCDQDGRTAYRYILSEDDTEDYDAEDNGAEDDFYDKYGTDDYDASSTTNILDLNRITYLL